MRLIVIGSLLFLALSGLVLAYLSAESNPDAPSPIGRRIEKVKVANIGIYSIFNVIAKEKGFFAAEGLDATVTEYDSGNTSMQALEDGEADFAIAADFVGAARMFDQPDLRIIATAASHDVFRIIGSRAKGVAQPLDLRGKKIGVTRRTAGEYQLGLFMQRHSIGMDEVELVDRPPPAMIEQFKNGELDAIVTFQPHAYVLEKELREKIVVWSAQRSQSINTTVYTNTGMLSGRRSAVDRYLRALIAAEEFYRQHPDESEDILVRASAFDPEFLRSIRSDFRHRIVLDQGLVFNLEDAADWIIDNGLTETEAKPNFHTRIDPAPLRRIQPEAVNLLDPLPAQAD